MTTSTKKPNPPKMCQCGKECRWWDATGNLPGFFASTCGSEACTARDEKARSVPMVDRLSAPSQTDDEIEHHRLVRAGCPRDFLRFTVKDFDGVDVPRESCNLLLTGPNGTGKSALSVALLRAWGNPCWWISAYRILATIKSTYRKQSEQSEAEVLDDFVARPLLVIDDLGAQHNTEFGLATIYEIIKERCENYRPTIVTTNLTFTEIDKVEPRLASRLAAFKVIKLVGKDRRLP